MDKRNRKSKSKKAHLTKAYIASSALALSFGIGSLTSRVNADKLQNQNAKINMSNQTIKESNQVNLKDVTQKEQKIDNPQITTNDTSKDINLSATDKEINNQNQISLNNNASNLQTSNMNQEQNDSKATNQITSYFDENKQADVTKNTQSNQILDNTQKEEKQQIKDQSQATENIDVKTDTQINQEVKSQDVSYTKKASTFQTLYQAPKAQVTKTVSPANNFINQISDAAVKASNDYGIYASLMIAQAGLESGWGQSGLALQGKNLFGVKWNHTGNYISMPTLESDGHKYYSIQAKFQKYDNWYDSLSSYARLIKNGYPASTKSGASSVEQATYNLRHGRYGSYATDPSYAPKIINLINSFDLKRFDNNNNTNQAYFDSANLEGNTIHTTGWHIADHVRDYSSAWMIAYDTTANREVTRVKYTPIAREDVRAAFPNVTDSLNSGFNVKLNIGNYVLDNHKIKLVARFSNNSATGEGNYLDFWSNEYLFKQNVGFIDSFDINGNNLNITGWHAADDSAQKPYRYVILLDKTANQEIARVKLGTSTFVGTATQISRPDAARAFNIYNAVNSGFNVSFNLNNINFVAGHNLQAVVRFTNDPEGNGYNPSDLYSYEKSFNQNIGYFDTIRLERNKLHITGWHAADASRTLANPFMILFDDTSKKELGRIHLGESNYLATSKIIYRPDVYKVFPNVYDGSNGGFDVNFDLTKIRNFKDVIGHSLRAVARFSNQLDGEGQYVDLWSAPIDLNQNIGYVDSFDIKNNRLNVSGWHASNISLIAPYSYVILVDKTLNSEISRIRIGQNSYAAFSQTVYRPDVSRAFPNLYNSENSGFYASFDLNRVAFVPGHEISVVLRITNDPDGDLTDTTSDTIVNKKTTSHNLGYFDNIRIDGTQLLVSGWHVSDDANQATHSIILFDKTLNKEVARIGLDKISDVALAKRIVRPDVLNVYPDILNSNYSGFEASFNLAKLPSIVGHDVVIVTRYYKQQNGNVSYSDLWSPIQNFNQNKSWIDTFKNTSNSLEISGWHAADASRELPNRFIILFDDTLNKEVARIELGKSNSLASGKTLLREDVARVFPKIYDAKNSGFQVTFNLNKINFVENHRYSIISRFSNDAFGEGRYVDSRSQKQFYL